MRANLPRLRPVAALLLGVLLLAVAPTRAELPPPQRTLAGQWLPLPGMATEAAGASDGTVAVLLPDERKLVLLPGLLKAGGGAAGDAVELEFPTTPTHLAAVRDADGTTRFAVMEPAALTIHVVAPDGKRLGTVRVEGGDDGQLGLAAAGGSVVFYGAADEASGATLGRADLAALKVLDPIRIDTANSAGDFQTFALSPDARRLYGRNVTSTPEGLRSFALDPAAGTGELTATKRLGRLGSYVVDPAGRHVAAGPDVFDADLTRRLAKLPEHVVAFVPGRAALLTLNLGDKDADPLVLRAWSTNTFEPASAVALPPGGPTAPVKNRRSNGRVYEGIGRDFAKVRGSGAKRVESYPRVVWADPAKPDGGGRAALVCGAYLVAMETKDLGLPSGPALAARVGGPRTLRIGEPATLRVTPADPAVRVTLADAPAGATLEGDQLTWTPAGTDVGPQRLVLSLTAPGVAGEARQDVEVEVVRPGLTLPFAPELVALSPDGKTLLAAVLDENAIGARGGYGNRPNADRNRFVAVDVTSGKTLLDRRAGGPLADAQVADGRVVVAFNGVDAVEVHDATDPAAPPRRLFVEKGRDNRSVAFALPGDGRLHVAAGGDDGRGFAPFAEQLYDLKTLERVVAPAHVATYGARPASLLPQPIGGGLTGETGGGAGWWYRGQRFAGPRLSAKPSNLVAPEGVLTPQVRQRSPAASRGDYNGRNGSPTEPWDTEVLAGSLSRTSGQNLARLDAGAGGYGGPENDASVVAAGVPLALLASLDAADGGLDTRIDDKDDPLLARRQRRRASLSLYDLNSGALQKRLVLGFLPRDAYAGSTGGVRLIAHAGGVAAVVGDVVYLLSDADLRAAAPEAAAPLHVLWDAAQGRLTAKPGDVLTLPTPTAGGKGKLAYTPGVTMPGFAVAGDGTATLDVSAALAARDGEVGKTLFQQAVAAARGDGGAASSTRPTLPDDVESPDYAAAVVRLVATLPSVARGAEVYEQVTGERAAGVVVSLPADVGITDERQQASTLWRTILVDVPPLVLVGPAVERYRQEQRDFKRQREENARRLAEREAQFRPSGPTTRGGLEDALRRVEELERENARLQAQLDLLRDMVGGGATSRPSR